MCVSNKSIKRLQQDCQPPGQAPSSDGRHFSFYHVLPTTLILTQTERRSLFKCCFKAGPSREADLSSEYPARTLRRIFSLLKSTGSFEAPVGSAIPLHQIISLVSMTTPRTFRPHKVSCSPAFVEFNMSESGYGLVLVLAEAFEAATQQIALNKMLLQPKVLN